MPAEGRENPLLKIGNFDAFFREKYLTKNKLEVKGTYDIVRYTYLELSATTLKYTVVKIDLRGLTKNG